MAPKIGLIGCGYWGGNYLKNLRDSKKFDLVSVCDLQNFPSITLPKDTEFTRDYRDTINCCDAIVIATPSETHYTIAKETLKKGKDVLVEKPLTTNSDTSKRLVEIAYTNNKILMVGHIFKYNPAFQRLKNEIKSGGLGNILYMTSSRESLGPIREKESVLWDLLPHDISMFLELNGMPYSVNAHGTSFLQKGIEDFVSLNMNFENGVMTSSRASWLHPIKIREVVVVGDKKMAVFDDASSTNKLTIYDKGVEEIGAVDLDDYRISCRTGDSYSPKLDSISPLEKQINHFAECVTQRKIPLTPGYEGYQVVKILEAGAKSLRENQEITLK